MSKIKQIIKKISLMGGYEVIKNKDCSHSLKKIYIKRPAIQFMKENLFGDLIGAEVGVYTGTNSEKIIKVLKPKKLYCIDPWIAYCNHAQSTMKGCKEQAIKRLSKYPKVEIMEMGSKKASEKIEDNSLDFIYVDGNHEYESVKKDISYWWDKIKVGGVMGGHDIETRKPHDGAFKAVAEFSVKNNLDVYCHAPDWWIVKEELKLI